MTDELDFAARWGATHHVTDLNGPVHWLHWDGPEVEDADEARARQSRTPLLLVHGLGGSVANWLTVAPDWAVGREVFALDLRGFGATPGHPADTSIFSNRDLVVAFLEQVVGRPAVLVGNSMGGMISTFVQRARPDLVKGLVLVDPALSPAGTRPDPAVTARFAMFAVPGVAESALRKARAKVPAEVLAKQLIELCFADISRSDPEVFEASLELARFRADAANGMGDVDRSFTRAARTLMLIGAQAKRYAAHLASLPGPVLLLHGDKDRLVNVAAARKAARANPGWDYVEFEGVGHTPQLEVPETTIGIVESWLDTKIDPDAAGASAVEVVGTGAGAR